MRYVSARCGVKPSVHDTQGVYLEKPVETLTVFVNNQIIDVVPALRQDLYFMADVKIATKDIFLGFVPYGFC